MVSRRLPARCFSLCDLRLFVIKRIFLSAGAAAVDAHALFSGPLRLYVCVYLEDSVLYKLPRAAPLVLPQFGRERHLPAVTTTVTTVVTTSVTTAVATAVATTFGRLRGQKGGRQGRV